MIELTEFEKLVKEMRYYQTQYFRLRGTGLLERAKQLEIRVDRYLREKEAVYKQPGLPQNGSSKTEDRQ